MTQLVTKVSDRRCHAGEIHDNCLCNKIAENKDDHLIDSFKISYKGRIYGNITITT